MSEEAVAIIPARGGSKRIPRKNLKPLLGKPVLAYTVETAIRSDCFAEVMVSTEDSEIAEVASRLGAKVPFPRSAARADDYAGTERVVEEVLHAYEAFGRRFRYACCLYPTAALVTSEQLRRGFDALVKTPEITGVIPIVRFSYPIQRAVLLRNGRVPMVHPEHYDSRSQDLEPTYHDAGQWYWLKVESFLNNLQLIGPNTAGIVVPDLEAQDVDTLEDWELLEAKLCHRLRRESMPHGSV